MTKKHKKPEFDFEGVFDPEDYMYFYADMLGDRLTNQQVEQLVQLLNLKKSAKILDLACGFGRHANRLAEAGHKVTGVDITPGFLEIARKSAEKSGVKVKYVQADMRKIIFRNEFDVVLSLFTSFGYFDDKENMKVLKNVTKALKPGGILCIDVLHRDGMVKHFVPCFVMEKGDDFMIDRPMFDLESGRIYNNRVVMKEGKKKNTPFSIRTYTVTELKELLHKAGLSVIGFYEDFDKKPLTTESRRLIMLARKGTGE
ncbi:MAG: methyltransferase type 11 [Candidatus Fischerbacteria bacterium RBG_13_37_8]|uniref:Methyltransferase type 11 n=1 Tax=Candidatus Fischerbacteria bacterium RBG_13_37_8 TaxID=1817863 RepID=A0A1F5VXM1_9BACT|nr:MAG: methyltransferase type 11 [Candidatus Fischerbacteria bacterium RBG_13_37_8]